MPGSVSMTSFLFPIFFCLWLAPQVPITPLHLHLRTNTSSTKPKNHFMLPILTFHMHDTGGTAQA